MPIDRARRFVRLLRLAVVGLTMAAVPAGAADPVSPPGDWQSPLHRDHPLVGTLWSVTGVDGDRAEVSPLDLGGLLRAMLAADVVLLGEKHDNPDHHLAQAWVLDRLVAANRRPPVVVEQIAADQADALAAWRRTDPATADGLAEAVDWSDSGWPAFGIYRPLFDRIVAADLALLPGDMAPAELRQVGRQGIASLEVDRRAELGLVEPLPEAAAAALDRILIDSHCGLIPAEAAPALRGVQRARDGALSAATRDALAAGSDRPVVVIAGTGHTRRDWGVPLVLARTAPEADSFTVALVEATPPLTDPADAVPVTDRVPAFDAVWFTPAITDRDYCADFR